jgi:hypothetical protein
MTAHSPDLKDYLLGPNAARVVRHANQSVMVIRGRGLIAPCSPPMFSHATPRPICRLPSAVNGPFVD